MTFGTIDFSKKTLAVAFYRNQYDRGNRGIVYNQKEMQTPVEAMHALYRMQVHIETEMGPCEMAKLFERDYGAHWTNLDGGVRAEFELPKDKEKYQLLLDDLVNHQEKFATSEEKKQYSSHPMLKDRIKA